VKIQDANYLLSLIYIKDTYLGKVFTVEVSNHVHISSYVSAQGAGDNNSNPVILLQDTEGDSSDSTPLTTNPDDSVSPTCMEDQTDSP